MPGQAKDSPDTLHHDRVKCERGLCESTDVCVVLYVLDVSTMFLLFLLVVLRFVSIRNLFVIAVIPFAQPAGVDSGPGEGGSQGVRGPPEPNTNIHLFL